MACTVIQTLFLRSLLMAVHLTTLHDLYQLISCPFYDSPKATAHTSFLYLFGQFRIYYSRLRFPEKQTRLNVVCYGQIYLIILD